PRMALVNRAARGGTRTSRNGAMSRGGGERRTTASRTAASVTKATKARWRTRRLNTTALWRGAPGRPPRREGERERRRPGGWSGSGPAAARGSGEQPPPALSRQQPYGQRLCEGLQCGCKGERRQQVDLAEA